NAKTIKNTLKERKVLRNASKLTVEGTEAVTEEASVVSEIEKLDDAMKKLKKWEKSDVVELKITKTGEMVKKCSKVENSYPPRTEEARREAQKVARAMEGVVPGKDHPSITVFTHQDGTVSVGLSGKTGTEKMKNNCNKLNEVLGEKYNVSPDTMPTDNLIQVGCPVGNCSEPKAVNAAHSNSSPITGYDTVWRGKGNMPEKYQYTGQNTGGKVEGIYEQMNPCETCAEQNNIKEYMNYANSNE
nr:hypothetical protein [Lachnospiraceae bacterium]